MLRLRSHTGKPFMKISKVPQYFILTVLAVVVLPMGIAFARNNELQVTCLGPDGNPLNRVQVFVQEIVNNALEEKRSNRQGIVAFNKLPDGHYRVFARERGFDPIYKEFIHLENGARESVTLSFQSGNPERPFYFEDEATQQRAVQLMQEGTQALQGQRYDEAERMLKESVELYPAEPNTFHNLGLLYLQTAQWEEAEATFRQLLDLLKVYVALESPTNPVFSQQSRDIQSLIDSIPLQRVARAVDEALQAGNTDEALLQLERLAQMQPEEGNANVYYSMAIALVQADRLEEAEQRLDRAIALKPDEAAFLELRSRLAQVKEAREENQLRAMVGEIQLLNQEEKHAEAIAQGKKALDQLPEEMEGLRAIAWAEIAQAHLSLEQYPEALEAYRMNLELSGEAADEGLFTMGEEFVRRGRQAQARLAFEKVLEINPDHAEAHYQLGMHYYYEAGDAERAKAMLERYLEIGKNEVNRDNASNVLVVMRLG